jgi:hypothetical protein
MYAMTNANTQAGEWPYGRASQELHWSPFLAQAREAAVEGGHGAATAAHGHHGHVGGPGNDGHGGAGDGNAAGTGTAGGNSGASAQAAAVVMAAAAADHALGFGVPSLFSMQAVPTLPYLQVTTLLSEQFLHMNQS